MSKRIVLWLDIIGIILALIGVAVFIPAVFSVAQTCTQAQINANTCAPTVSTGASAGILIGVLLFIVAGLLSTIAWIGALVRAAKMQDWVWFVVVLVFHGIGALVYAIAGPPDNPVPAAAYPPQGYPPQYPPQYPQQ